MSKETDKFIKHYGFDYEIIVECNYGFKSDLKHLFNEYEKWLVKKLTIPDVVVPKGTLCDEMCCENEAKHISYTEHRFNCDKCNSNHE